MSLTAEELVAIAEWAGWNFQRVFPRVFRWRDSDGIVAGEPAVEPLAADDKVRCLPDFENDSHAYMPLFERLAKEYGMALEFFDDVSWCCRDRTKSALGKRGCVGHVTLGAAVCGAVLDVIAAEKAAETLSSTKSKEK